MTIKESGEQMIASVTGKFGEFSIDVDGHFQNIQELHNIDLNIVADGPNIGTISRLFGREYSASDPFKFRGKISRVGTEVTIDSMLVQIGASRLTVDGFFADFPSVRGGHLSLLSLNSPDKLATGRFTTTRRCRLTQMCQG